MTKEIFQIRAQSEIGKWIKYNLQDLITNKHRDMWNLMKAFKNEMFYVGFL